MIAIIAHSLCCNSPQRLLPWLVTALCTLCPVTNSSCLRKEPARRKGTWRTVSLCLCVTGWSCWRSTFNFLRLWLVCHCHSLLDSKITLLSLLLGEVLHLTSVRAVLCFLSWNGHCPVLQIPFTSSNSCHFPPHSLIPLVIIPSSHKSHPQSWNARLAGATPHVASQGQWALFQTPARVLIPFLKDLFQNLLRLWKCF